MSEDEIDRQFRKYFKVEGDAPNKEDPYEPRVCDM